MTLDERIEEICRNTSGLSSKNKIDLLDAARELRRWAEASKIIESTARQALKELNESFRTD